MNKMTDSCHIYGGYIDNRGYGRIYIEGKRIVAHKVVYESIHGSVPDGLVLDHLCKERACINPLHLEPVTQRENVLRGDGIASICAKRTHCSNGHEYTPENMRIGKRGRQCRACDRVYATRYRTRCI